MAVRIQLASNFQVIELTYDSWAEVNEPEVEAAKVMVNLLGQTVVNDIKSSKPQPNENEVKPASEKQIKYAVQLGLDEDRAKKMNSKEVWSWIQKNK